MVIDSESDQRPEERPEKPRTTRDVDGSFNALWTLFRDEAKSHSNARINTLKDVMECPYICAFILSG